MKEKNKKIITGIAASTLACLSVCTFAGCSNLEINQTQVNSTIENLQQSVDELKQQNEYLKNLNQQALKDHAWDLFQQSSIDFILNNNDIRNNIIVTTYNDGVMADKQIYYTKENNDTIYIREYDDISYKIAYKDNSKVYEYFKQSGGHYDKTEYSEEIIDSHQIVTPFSIYPYYTQFTKDNISSIEILSNGNYSINFIITESIYNESEDQTITAIAKCEIIISADYKILSSNTKFQTFFDSPNENGTFSDLLHFSKIEYVYQIDESTLATINQRLGEAKAAEVNRNN